VAAAPARASAASAGVRRQRGKRCHVAARGCPLVPVCASSTCQLKSMHVSHSLSLSLSLSACACVSVRVSLYFWNTSWNVGKKLKSQTQTLPMRYTPAPLTDDETCACACYPKTRQKTPQKAPLESRNSSLHTQQSLPGRGRLSQVSRASPLRRTLARSLPAPRSAPQPPERTRGAGRAPSRGCTLAEAAARR